MGAGVLVVVFHCGLVAAKPVRIAAAQVLTNDGDVGGNIKRISDAVAAAATKGAELVAFPETSVGGWMWNAVPAPPIPGNWTQAIGALARKHGVWLLMGMTETADNHLYDTAVLFDRDGAVQLKHRKNNIVCHEQGCTYTPGHGVTTVETEWGRVGVLICADTFNETLVAQMGSLHPDLVIVPHGFQAPPKSNHGGTHCGQLLLNQVSVTAKRVGAPVVGVNNVGAVSVPGNTLVGNTYCGWSNWADKHGSTRDIAADRNVDLPVWTVDTTA